MTLYYLLLIFTRFHSDPRFGMPLFKAAFVLVTPVKVIGLLTICAAVLLVPPEDAAPRLKNPLALLFFGFAGFQVVEVLVYRLPIPADSLASLLSIGLLLVATRGLVNTEERMRTAVRVMIVASAIASMWIYRQYFFLHVFPPNGIEQDTNFEALTLVCGIPLAVWMVRYERKSSWKRVAMVCVGLMIGGVLLTESRAGVIAAVVMGLAAVFVSRRKMLTLVLVVIAVVAGVEIAPAKLRTRFESIKLEGKATNGAEESTRIHIELAKAGLAMIETYPLTGIGLEQFEAAAPDYNPALLRVAGREYVAHDTYIQIASESGLPVLMLFLGLIAMAIVNCRSAGRGSNLPMARMALAMQIGLIGYGVAAASVTAEYVPTFWLLIFFSQNLKEIVVSLPEPSVRLKGGPAEPGWERPESRAA